MPEKGINFANVLARTIVSCT